MLMMIVGFVFLMGTFAFFISPDPEPQCRALTPECGYYGNAQVITEELN